MPPRRAIASSRQQRCATASRQQRQCAKCPWKVSTDPHDIPGGYDVEKHRRLTNTIASADVSEQLVDFISDKPMRIMACHESDIGEERPCVGWLHNQLGDGNNLSLRLKVVFGKINGDYVLDGEQHACIEDTLPKDMP